MQSPSVGLPVAIFRNSADRYFRVSDIPNLQPNSSYSVRIRPHFANGVVGVWGPARCLNIGGSAGMELAEEELEMLENRSTAVEEISSLIYPNPSSSGEFYLYDPEWVGASVTLTIYDAMGKMIKNEKFVGAESYYPVYGELDSGLYTVVIQHSENRVIHRLVVAR